MYPVDLKYTAEHEWVRVVGTGPDAIVRVGITHYAQEALGDVVFVTLPAIGTALDAGQALGEVESTKSVSDIYAPLAGEVVARNEALEDNPELVNSDPYGEGWLVELAPADPAGPAPEATLDSAAYRRLLD